MARCGSLTRSARARPMAANPASAAPRSTTCATTSPASISPIARFLRTALKAADAKLADAVTRRIEQLKTIVAAPDLPHVDVPRAAARQRGIGGRAAGRVGQAGIAAADAGGAIAMIVRSLCGSPRLALGLLIAGLARTRRGVSGRRRPDRVAGENRTQRGRARQAARSVPLGSSPAASPTWSISAISPSARPRSSAAWRGRPA